MIQRWVVSSAFHCKNTIVDGFVLETTEVIWSALASVDSGELYLPLPSQTLQSVPAYSSSQTLPAPRLDSSLFSNIWAHYLCMRLTRWNLAIVAIPISASHLSSHVKTEKTKSSLHAHHTWPAPVLIEKDLIADDVRQSSDASSSQELTRSHVTNVEENMLFGAVRIVACQSR